MLGRSGIRFPMQSPPPPTDEIPFDRSISAKPGEVQTVSRLVRRLIANNGGPFTFTGTCTYVIGHGDVVVVDPGPADAHHIRALQAAIAGETLHHILVTHTHRDHSPGAEILKAATGAPIVGCAPRQPATDPYAQATLDAAFDRSYRPDVVLADGETISGKDFRITAVATPGHTSNHLAFALEEDAALFSGDHVMAWSTTVVVPPEGSMRDYMASLRKLIGRSESIYWPGHGGPVRNPQSFVNALIVHRQWREAAILRCLAGGDATVPTIVGRIYRKLAPALKGAAGQSVLAHLIDLAERGRVLADTTPSLKARYWLP